jgi:hypothetical protein
MPYLNVLVATSDFSIYQLVEDKDLFHINKRLRTKMRHSKG